MIGWRGLTTATGGGGGTCWSAAAGGGGTCWSAAAGDGGTGGGVAGGTPDIFLRRDVGRRSSQYFSRSTVSARESAEAKHETVCYPSCQKHTRGRGLQLTSSHVGDGNPAQFEAGSVETFNSDWA